jgi:hypothetical protein
MQQPESYLGHVDKLFHEHGKLVSDSTGKFLREFMRAFAHWVERSDLRASASDAPRQARASVASG